MTFTSREEDYTNITTRVDNPVGLQVMGGRIVNVNRPADLAHLDRG